MPFKELPEALTRALADIEFTTPTPIQSAAIPVVMAGKDLIGCAQTGTGKTAAFAIPMICRLLEDEKANGLILVPTRELAVQVQNVFIDLTKYTPDLRTVLLIGGVPLGPQVAGLRRGPRIVVATPGRLCDHLRQGTIRLQSVRMLVLDEADRMLDMGFAPQLKDIMKDLPAVRQTLLFSATMAKEIEALANKLLKSPERITIGERSAPNAKIRHSVIQVETKAKNDRLLEEVSKREGLVLVFARTKHRTDKVANFLEDYGVKAGRIHGNRSQSQRTKAIDDFRSGRLKVLCATDIAARGIDIPEIELVINFDLPDCAEDYVHRIGRTARAGLGGEALAILIPEDRHQWKLITKLIHGKVEGSVEPVKVQTAAPSAFMKGEDGEMVERPARRERPAPFRDPRRNNQRAPSAPRPPRAPREAGSFERRGTEQRERFAVRTDRPVRSDRPDRAPASARPERNFGQRRFRQDRDNAPQRPLV